MMKNRPIATKKDRKSGGANSSRAGKATSTTSITFIRVARYGECQKNHAANIGAYAVDGCLEYMGSGAEGTVDGLMCAACNCHRNFHKRMVAVDAEVVCEYSPPSSAYM